MANVGQGPFSAMSTIYAWESRHVPVVIDHVRIRSLESPRSGASSVPATGHLSAHKETGATSPR